MIEDEELPEAPAAVVDETMANPVEKEGSLEDRLDRCLEEFVASLPYDNGTLTRISISRSNLRKALPGLKSAILEEVNKA